MEYGYIYNLPRFQSQNLQRFIGIPIVGRQHPADPMDLAPSAICSKASLNTDWMMEGVWLNRGLYMVWYIYKHICICMYKCIYCMYLYTVYMYEYVYIYIYVCILYIYMYVYIYIYCTYICVYNVIYMLHVCIFMYIIMYIYIYIYVYIPTYWTLLNHLVFGMHKWVYVYLKWF